MVQQKAQKKEESMVAVAMDDAANRAPAKYAPYIRQAKPAVVAIANGIDVAWPYVVKAYDAIMNFWEMLQPYNPQQFFPLLLGIALCFFGGSYLTLVAAAEAVRLSVWDKLSKSLSVLYDNYKKAAAESKKDDDIDADGDGVADVKQITKKELLSRKIYVILRSIDPQQSTEALATVWAGFLAVLATVRIKFAQCFTLGAAIGDMVGANLGDKIEPKINKLLPPELAKWSQPATDYIFKALGVFIAFFLSTIIGAFHSSIRGGQLIVSNCIILAKKYGHLDAAYDEHSKHVSLISSGVAIFGFFWQLKNGFGVPFPLNILFLPATIMEYVLEVSIMVL
jgi:hypothetical protein